MNDELRKPSEAQDEQYAQVLISRRYTEGLYPQELAWLREWQSRHQAPEPNYQVGRQRETDLGVYMEGLEVLGDVFVDEYGTGNVHVGGGFFFRAGNIPDENRWDVGWMSQLSGLNATLEAIGAEPIEGAEEPLGPFVGTDNSTDLQQAYSALACRMLAALTIVSRHAISAIEGAEARVLDQEHRFDAEMEQRRAEAPPSNARTANGRTGLRAMP